MFNSQIKKHFSFSRAIKRGAGLVTLGLVAVWPASAHDFWMQPEQFSLPIGTATPVSLFVGHGVDKHLWDADIKRVVRLFSVGPNGTTDQRNNFTQGGTGILSFVDQGYHVAALESNRATSALSASEFNAYLVEEGLTSAVRHRKNNKLTNTSGTETYSRRAKSLFRVGTPTLSHSALVTRPLGLTLEIVPEQNPHTLPAAAPIPFRIYFEGRPLRGATVKLTDLSADAEPVAKQISNASGRVAFLMPRQGQWQVNVVWTKPLPRGSSAQFDTIFSSLTFGFDPIPAS